MLYTTQLHAGHWYVCAYTDAQWKAPELPLFLVLAERAAGRSIYNTEAEAETVRAKVWEDFKSRATRNARGEWKLN